MAELPGPKKIDVRCPICGLDVMVSVELVGHCFHYRAFCSDDSSHLDLCQKVPFTFSIHPSLVHQEDSG